MSVRNHNNGIKRLDELIRDPAQLGALVKDQRTVSWESTVDQSLIDHQAIPNITPEAQRRGTVMNGPDRSNTPATVAERLYGIDADARDSHWNLAYLGVDTVSSQASVVNHWKTLGIDITQFLRRGEQPHMYDAGKLTELVEQATTDMDAHEREDALDMAERVARLVQKSQRINELHGKKAAQIAQSLVLGTLAILQPITNKPGQLFAAQYLSELVSADVYFGTLPKLFSSPEFADFVETADYLSPANVDAQLAYVAMIRGFASEVFDDLLLYEDGNRAVDIARATLARFSNNIQTPTGSLHALPTKFLDDALMDYGTADAAAQALLDQFGPAVLQLGFTGTPDEHRVHAIFPEAQRRGVVSLSGRNSALDARLLTELDRHSSLSPPDQERSDRTIGAISGYLLSE